MLAINCISIFFAKTFNSYTELPKFADDISSVEVKNVGSSTEEKRVTNETCLVCLGILQTAILDQKKETTICKGNIAVLISEAVRHEGYEVDSFCLEVSIPPNTAIRDRACWLYVKQKYGSEEWFKNVSAINRLSVKEALKFSLIKPLEDLLGKKSDVNSSFRVSLIYNHIGLSQEVDVEDSKKMMENVEKQGKIIAFIVLPMQQGKRLMGVDILQQLSAILIPCQMMTLLRSTNFHQQSFVNLANVKSSAIDHPSLLVGDI